jgi:hypothetical protein
LARAARLDAEAGNAPGYLFNALSQVIGGANAEPRSHIVAVLRCLRELWSDPSTAAFRQPTTGLLLRQLITGRHNDYAVLVNAVVRFVRDLPELRDYVRGWVRGHFLPPETLRFASDPG